MQAPGTQRIAWLDVAKGACIVLVVLHHVIGKYLPLLAVPALHPVADAWAGVSLALKPARMPVFFVVSGFLAAGAIARPWPTVLRRVVSPYYLYLVWLGVYLLFYRWETRTPANRVQGVGDLLSDLVWAETSMWFLFSLAAYFVLAKALRRLDPRFVVGAATVVALGTGWSGIEANNKVAVLAHFCFFALGAYFPALLAWAGNRSGRALLGLAAAYTAGFVLLRASGLPWSVTLVACSAVGVPLGLGLAARLAGVPGLGQGLAWLGQRTLRIYVLHFAVIGVLVALPLRLDGTGPAAMLLAAAAPLLGTALVIGACLALHDAAVYLGGAALFRLPRPVERGLSAVERRFARRVQGPWGTGQPGAPVAPSGAALAPVGAKVPSSASA
ncbi:acyltransferase [Nocardioides sp. GY 10113]|uniref:acyltransferase family protein n=1 Tax=Nocardioides sp. GY 10113 TaxID=2569761 RepID=UPI001458E2FD|nr:acyltransferase [Nocardioides sp. GY 10113]